MSDAAATQKKREQHFRNKDVPFGKFTVREKTAWWSAIELSSAFEMLEWRQGLCLWDIGASDGRFLEFVRRKDAGAFLVGTDFAQTPLQSLINIPASAVCADAARPLFKSHAFDRAVSLQVLHHVPSKEERQRFLSCVHAALKPGGVFVVSVLNRAAWQDMVGNGREGQLLTNPELYVYLYEPGDLAGELAEAGFVVTDVCATNSLPLRYLKVLGGVGVYCDRMISRVCRGFSVIKGRYLLAVCRKR